MSDSYFITVKVCEVQTNEKYAKDKALGRVITLPFGNLVCKKPFEQVILIFYYYFDDFS